MLSVQVSEEVVAQGTSTEAQDVLAGSMLEESPMSSIPVTMSSQDGTPFTDNAVYVAIDPSQPDVHQLLGQIQVVSAEMSGNASPPVTEVWANTCSLCDISVWRPRAHRRTLCIGGCKVNASCKNRVNMRKVYVREI